MSAVNIEFPGNLAQVDTLDDLRRVPTGIVGADILCLVVEAQGIFTFDFGSYATDDGKDTIRPNDRTPLQAGRWIRAALGLGPGPPGPTGPGDARTVSFTVAAPVSGTVSSALVDRGIYITDPPYNAKADGVTSADAAYNAAIATGKMVYAAGKFNIFGGVEQYNSAKFRKVQVGEAVDSAFGERIEITNPTGITGYGLRRGYYNHTGNINNGRNVIGDAVLLKVDSITNGYSWNTWEVAMSPLNPASPFPGKPTSAQNFSMVIEEANPQNRHSDPGWEGELRRWANCVGGYQMIPETQDFTSLLGQSRVGYNITFAFGVIKSPFSSTVNQRHPKFYNGIFANPCAIAKGGYMVFATGYRTEVTTVSVSNGGTGYTIGDILTFNTGLDGALNENSQARVLAIGAGGVVTLAEVWVSGWYQQSFASPVPTTGGTGTGCTLGYSLSTDDESPQAWGGINGTWNYALDAVCPRGVQSDTGRGYFRNAFMRVPNDTQIIHARNSGDTANLSFLRLTTANDWQVSEPAVNVSLRGKLKLPEVAALNFASDSAAATGGVQIGELYHNAGQVRIRIA